MSPKYTLTGIALSAVFLAGCSLPGQTPSTAPTDTEGEVMLKDDTMMEGEEKKDGDAMMMEDDRSMTVDSFMFGYSEETITAKAGETIEVTLTNSEGMHDLKIDELNVDSSIIKQGETTTFMIEIPADTAPGTEYEYYCSVGNHRAQGMVGTLIVE